MSTLKWCERQNTIVCALHLRSPRISAYETRGFMLKCLLLTRKQRMCSSTDLSDMCISSFGTKDECRTCSIRPEGKLNNYIPMAKYQQSG